MREPPRTTRTMLTTRTDRPAPTSNEHEQTETAAATVAVGRSYVTYQSGGERHSGQLRAGLGLR